MRLPDNLDVWIVDDDDATLATLHHALSRCGWDVFAFPSVERLKANLAVASPGCVISDLCIGEEDGLALIQHIHESVWPAPSILISGCLSPTLAARAMRAGVSMVVEKPFSLESLVSEVAAALRQAESVRSQISRQVAARQALSCLTVGQVEVLQQLIDGRPHKQIAARLNIALRTVELRKKQIFEKLQVETFTELLSLVHFSDQERSPLHRCNATAGRLAV
jgi:two-component system response regulator FixJ